MFNTLNVISGMARLEEAQTTEKMILALSSLFRYNLKTPEQFVLLAKELNVAADYMYLQQMRFGERIRYELDCKARQELVMVPALSPAACGKRDYSRNCAEGGRRKHPYLWSGRKKTGCA